VKCIVSTSGFIMKVMHIFWENIFIDPIGTNCYADDVRDNEDDLPRQLHGERLQHEDFCAITLRANK